ncbi:bifunctional DNA-formamidopyrimidine glycosylase/DNA-(apurinic or apyrimidinic site) lyase [candidate division WOR-3 bacterium]|nr:bifunctional DNA-formamidopyrimidine glycosylase/DNA-(apurinic or apyrimidinic site) lyase [candidate division WOR-3 bacterium]
MKKGGTILRFIMPELPEVETIRRELKTKIINQKIKNCIILRRDVIAYPGPKKFYRSIVNEEIIDVIRRAKYLILELTNNKRLIFHLRLSGTISLKNYDAEPERFTRVIVKLQAYQLFFNEPRALGRIYLVKNGENPKILKGFFNLGYEPISPEFDFNYLRKKIKGRKARIKSLLLDQHICAGIGNIYSDEALFQAGVRPLRRAHRLTIEETFKLLLSLKDVLNKAIDNFGTSVSDYKRTDGKNGSFQDFLYVYSKEGEPCRVCGTKIVVRKIGSRSTRYCPKCQK